MILSALHQLGNLIIPLCSIIVKIYAAQLLGFPTYIPPYERTRGVALLRGVNYASGAAGIRDETGNNLVYISLITPYINNYIYMMDI
jgi:hypothetical protein